MQFTCCLDLNLLAKKDKGLGNNVHLRVTWELLVQVIGRSVSLVRQTTIIMLYMENFVSLRALADIFPPEWSASFGYLIS